MLNETHDPQLSSWVASARRPGCDFPIQNLPHGVFRRRATPETFRGGVAIGDMILDLAAACEAGVFEGSARRYALAASAPTLNDFMALGPAAWSALRLQLSRLLRAGAQSATALAPCLVPQEQAEYRVAAQIGDFTDFLSSWHHMSNLGRIFHPDVAELPNFRWLPIAYHGRSSSIEISGTDFHRPRGQTRAPGEATASFGPTRKLDYEVELGFFIGPGNRRGEPIGVDTAEDHVFGLCLLNDWSARDVQGWESTPLGPFLSKSFMTSVSPWIVTLEALAPYRCALPREGQTIQGLPYLESESTLARGGLDIQLEASLRVAGGDALAPDSRLSLSSARHGHWSLAQMVAHHTEGGCNLRSGDLLGTGTQSGPTQGEEGCLMELTAGGKQPFALPDGRTRVFLEDGDTVVLRAWCESAGHARIGFGECRGTVLPAIEAIPSRSEIQQPQETT